MRPPFAFSLEAVDVRGQRIVLLETNIEGLAIKALELHNAVINEHNRANTAHIVRLELIEQVVRRTVDFPDQIPAGRPAEPDHLPCPVTDGID